jgi:hypothetical protein
MSQQSMDCKYAVVQSNRLVVKRCRGKRTQPKRLDGASVRDPSLNLPQGEVDNRLRINQPHSQAPAERKGSDKGNMMGKAKNGVCAII